MSGVKVEVSGPLRARYGERLEVPWEDGLTVKTAVLAAGIPFEEVSWMYVNVYLEDEAVRYLPDRWDTPKYSLRPAGLASARGTHHR